MKWSLYIGKIAEIRLLLHWTFLILVLWIGFAQIFRGGSINDALYSMGTILAVFAIVVLHELGHALTARRYGIQTRKILLLPIGGIADLERIPEDPKEELVIAIAGPMVNVVIAAILYFTTPVKSIFLEETDLIELARYQLFWATMFSINVLLILFNMIPAFPLDGGRVLRALLAFRMNRSKATRIAFQIGQFIAIVFVFVGLFINPFLSIIGVFIFFAAQSENYITKHQEFLGKYVARDAMITNFTMLAPTTTLREVSDRIIHGSEQDFVILENGKLAGILTYPVFIQGLRDYSWETLVKNIMVTSFDNIDVNENLDKIFIKLQRDKISFLPVVENNELAGIINLNNINEFLMIKSAEH
jgi:Zn-dependent protease/predicted transcriptional regulator